MKFAQRRKEPTVGKKTENHLPRKILIRPTRGI